METRDNKTQSPLSPGSPTTPEMQKGESEAKKFLEQLLHTSARAKHRVSLYPEHHPLVQELLSELHLLIAEALMDRTELMLEFQPGRIVVDKKHVIGNRENIARFSQEMYLRRVARLSFDNSLDLTSLFKFLKFINTEVDVLHKQAEMDGKFFPGFRGIHLEEVDYTVLAKVRGESLDTEHGDEEKRNVIEILFGKRVIARYGIGTGGVAIGQFIPLSENVMEFLKGFLQKGERLPRTDPNLPPGIQVSRAFRNILDAIEIQNPPDAGSLKRELAESYLRMPLEIRSELLIEELQETRGGGDLVPLLRNLPEEELREFFDSLTNQFKMEDFPELAAEIDALSKTLFQQGEGHTKRKKEVSGIPSAVPGDEFATSLRNNLSPPVVMEHFHMLLYEIFEKSEELKTIEQCLVYVTGDLKVRLGEKQWKIAESLLQKIIATMRGKKFFGTDFYHTVIEKLQKNAFEVLNPLLADSLAEDDLEIIDQGSGIFRLFNQTPEQVLLKLLVHVEDRSLRKKILLYVLDSEDLPQDTLSEMLNHEEWYVVRNAVTLIREKGDSRFLPLLEKTLSHAQPPVQKETLLALGRIRHKKALGLLIRVYQDNERAADIRVLALDCMSGFQDPAPREIYLELLQDRRNPFYDFDLRATGIKQLGTYNDKEIIDALVSFTKKFHLFHRKKWQELKKSASLALESMNTPEAKEALRQVNKSLLRK
jgi:hypothetical protein